MKQLQRKTINIRQLKHAAPELANCSFGGDLLVTNRLSDLRQLYEPCNMDAITVCVCLSGFVDCSINMTNYRLGPHTMLVMLPGDVVRLLSANNAEAYALLVSTSFLRQTKIDFKNRTSAYIDLRQNPRFDLTREHVSILRHYYALCRESLQLPGEELAEAMAGLMRAFAYTIISIIRQARPTGEVEGNERAARYRQIFDKFVSLLIQHYRRERSVSFYASQMFMTPKYLSHAVKEYSGRGALDWINEYVTLETRMMLRDTEITIKEIAYQMNFQSQSAFGKYFKQQLGINPLAYRNGQEPTK